MTSWSEASRTVAPATRIREVPSGEWDALLVRLGLDDLYLRESYVRLAATIEEGEPVLLHLSGPQGDVVFPLLLRAVPDSPFRDAITPYGYGGPVAGGLRPPIAEFHVQWAGWCAARQVVSTFIRFHPLYANHSLPQPENMVMRPLAGTVGWRLDAGGLMDRMRGDHRNKVRKAARAGVTVTMDAGPDSLRAFRPMYRETMQRAGASGIYHFSNAHWDVMRDELADALVFANAWYGGDLVASALCLRSGPWLHYHLSSSTDTGRTFGAPTMALYEAASWAQESGCTRLHLGGGVGGHNDSLLDFKRRFDPGAGLLESCVGWIVHDQGAYQELAPGATDDGFFPAYRDPARRPARPYPGSGR